MVDRGPHGAVMIDNDAISDNIGGWFAPAQRLRRPIDAVGCAID